jgi:hypothetical protein
VSAVYPRPDENGFIEIEKYLRRSEQGGVAALVVRPAELLQGIGAGDGQKRYTLTIYNIQDGHRWIDDRPTSAFSCLR